MAGSNMRNHWKFERWIAVKMWRWVMPAIFFLSSALPAVPQSGKQQWPRLLVSHRSSDQSPIGERQDQDEEVLRAQKENARRANEQRQLELKRDTDKLMQLTNELKQYVDQTNENILSLEVIRKADEIERLAKNVKIKMRGKD